MAADVPVTIEFEGEGSDAIRETKAVTQELNNTNKEQEKSISLTNLLVFARRRLLTVSAAVAAVGLGKKLLGEAAAIDAFSQSVEVSSGKVQEWAVAAKRTGITMDDIREVLLNLTREQGAESSIFRQIGLDLAEVRNASPERLFELLVSKIDEGKMSASELGAAIRVMGGNGEKVFLALSNGFSRFAKQAREDGRIVAEEALDPMNESMAAVSQSFDRIVETVKGGMTPALEAAAKATTPLLDGINMSLIGLKNLGGVAFKAAKLGLGFTLPGADTGALARDMVDSAQGVGLNTLADMAQQQGDLEATRTNRGAASQADLARQLGRAQRFDELADQLGRREAVDGFARAGLFVTPGAASAQTSQQRQIAILRRIADNTRNTVQAVQSN